MGKKLLWPTKKSPSWDTQQYELYRMEAESFNGLARARMTLKQCQSLSRAVARSYGVPVARIRFKDLKGWAGECRPDGRIYINPKRTTALSVMVIAHELAHHVHNHLAVDVDEYESHGKEFMCVYMDLLDTARLMPVQGMRALCKAYGVKYIDPRSDKTKSIRTLRRLISKGRTSARPV